MSSIFWRYPMRAHNGGTEFGSYRKAWCIGRAIELMHLKWCITQFWEMLGYIASRKREMGNFPARACHPGPLFSSNQENRDLDKFTRTPQYSPHTHDRWRSTHDTLLRTNN
jgi:hypothetical protein